MGKCPNLQKINLSWTNITGAAFDSKVIKLENLHEIDISYHNKLTDDHLKKLIETCPNLQKINLSHTDITGQAFDSHNIKLEHLTEIDMSWCKWFTDEYLKILLEKCSNLQKINLFNTNITGTAFDSKDIKLENLHEIDISYCKNLTGNHLKRLLEKCPNARNNLPHYPC
jgi:uncharacterized protein YjbI with pentapeptide repeats